MVARIVVDIDAARRAYESAELAFQDALQAERTQFDRWQESYGATQVAQEEAGIAFRRYQTAVGC